MHSGKVFGTLRSIFVQYFKENGQRMKEKRSEGYFFQKSGQNTVFWYFFEKITFKSLLLLRSLTILLENLYEGTSQGCKKLDRSAFLNFCFFCYLQHIKICENIHFHRILCYK